MIEVAELMRTLDAVKNGAADTLNNETLLWLEAMLDNAKLRCENIRLRRLATVPPVAVKIPYRERKKFLRKVVNESKLTGNEPFGMLEQIALRLKREGFYAQATGNADIVMRLRDTAKKANGGAQ